jgi:hypothetical protein
MHQQSYYFIWVFTGCIGVNHRYQKTKKNRLLKVCYVPTTSTRLPRLLFPSFWMQPLTVLMKQTWQAVCTIKQSIYLDVYGVNTPSKKCFLLIVDFSTIYFHNKFLNVSRMAKQRNIAKCF